ncbi:S-adenosyl-L-methionine-dependent methyltransferase [Aspergillus ambiguus]|uniref:S-adenosyl-L-methionine-dependent methyltransferase n=1 Tax=Aspergillus ambiguus TaxID=176160 RepID=UPI003CCDF27B
MARKAELEKLAALVQNEVASYDESDLTAWIRIQNAVSQLRRATEPPTMFVMKQRFHVVENISLVAALHMGLLQRLTECKDESRVIRIMIAIEFVDEVGYQTYIANANTLAQCMPGNLGGTILTNNMTFHLGDKIGEYLNKNKPCDIGKTPSAYEFAFGETTWAIFTRDAVWKKGFDDNMTMRNKTISTPWHKKYPVKEGLSTGKPVIVDIGGNQGVDLQRFADDFPEIDCELVLQDLPETIKGIPAGTLSPKVKPVAYDFFTDQVVNGADIYYLKSVLHDWDDISSVNIISNTAKAMQSYSRLLINGIVLLDTNESLLKCDMDMLMLYLCNGMERTKTQWEELLAKAEPALKLVNVWSVQEDQQSVIEARLA